MKSTINNHFNKAIACVIVLLIIGLAFTAIGCVSKETQEQTEGTESIIAKGSDTMLPLCTNLSEKFTKIYPTKSVTIIGGGSGVGIAALIDGEIDIAMASRVMKEEEIQTAQKNGINPVKTVIAIDGIAVVVNAENPVTQLNFTQLKAIYDGNISNWKDVGGEDRPIAVMTRDSSSGTYEYFKEEVLDKREYRPDALTQTTTGSVVQEISENKGAIGYIGYAYLEDSMKALALDAGEGFVPATEDKILSGEYPLARELQLYTNGETQGLTKEFIDFVLSPDGQAIVSEIGYFPIK